MPGAKFVTHEQRKRVAMRAASVGVGSGVNRFV
jgi:hypothetical protein